MDSKIESIRSQMLKISSTAMCPVLDYLPEDVKLPVTTEELLEQLNEKLKNDKEFSVILVRIKRITCVCIYKYIMYII